MNSTTETNDMLFVHHKMLINDYHFSNDGIRHIHLGHDFSVPMDELLIVLRNCVCDDIIGRRRKNHIPDYRLKKAIRNLLMMESLHR